jgi:hypothetical protein
MATIGTLPLQRLTALELDQAYAGLLSLGRSARTVRASHVAVLKMLREAVRLGKVGRNVALDAPAPSQGGARQPIRGMDVP